MDLSSLADQVIHKQNRSKYEGEKFDILNAPDIIMWKHPAIYRWHGWLYHEHNLVRLGDIDYLLHLIDMPDAKITRGNAIWLYNRLVEAAPPLSERYLLVSKNLVWDRNTARLIPIERFGKPTTTKDKTTLRLRREEDDRRASADRMGQAD